MYGCVAVALLGLFASCTDAAGITATLSRAAPALKPMRLRSPLRLKGGAPAGRKVLDEAVHTLESTKNNKKGTISLEVAKNADRSYECTITSTIPGPVWLHWGFASRGAGWNAPPDQYQPAGTKKVRDKTSFSAHIPSPVTHHSLHNLALITPFRAGKAPRLDPKLTTHCFSRAHSNFSP